MLFPSLCTGFSLLLLQRPLGFVVSLQGRKDGLQQLPRVHITRRRADLFSLDSHPYPLKGVLAELGSGGHLLQRESGFRNMAMTTATM